MTGCPSEFALERWRLGELSGPSAAATATHTTTCPLCTARVEALAAPPPPFDLDAVLAAARNPPRAPDILSFTRATAPLSAGWRAFRRRFVALALPLVGAVAAAVLLWPGPPRDTLKGGTEWTLRVLVKAHGREAVDEVASGARLSRGDRLRFEARTTWPRGYVLVLSLDAAGLVSPWVPAQGTTLEVSGGQRVLLDGAIELDGSAGAERVELIACHEPRPVASLVAEARNALGHAHGDLRTLPSYAAGCHRETFWIEKVKP